MSRKTSFDISYNPHRIERSSGRAEDAFSEVVEVGRAQDVGEISVADSSEIGEIVKFRHSSAQELAADLSW